jgi:arylformamidase
MGAAMKVYDISLTLRQRMPVYPGESTPLLEPTSDMERGASYNVSRLTISTHTGTHIDAPRHFLLDGASVDRIPVDVLVGPALVVEMAVDQEITAADLEVASIPPGTERLLFKTRNSRLLDDEDFRRDFVYLTLDAARWLVEHGVRLVAIDYLSVEKMDAQPNIVHETLLRAGVVIVEGVDLRQVAPGPYFLACLPLKIEGADGSPVRAVLVEM